MVRRNRPVHHELPLAGDEGYTLPGREDEVLAVVIRRERAHGLGIAYDHVAAYPTSRAAR
jgi:hypothetical protein